MNLPYGYDIEQVQAIDKDPMNAGGSITYAIEDKTEDFVIDELTGQVRTNKVSDLCLVTTGGRT